jgi:predicted nicotinamide N-methyase
MKDEEVKRLRARLAREWPLTDLTVTVGGRDWFLTMARDEDALLERVQTDAELERFPYGLLMWASAVGLAERLAEEPGLVAGKRVLEIGAGVGLPGLVAQSLGGIVTQTDYQHPALSLCQLNAARNGVAGIRYFLADWRAFDHAERYDLLLGSDVLYERALHYELASILARALAPGGIALLSDPLRPQATEFIDRLELDGWQVNMESHDVKWEADAREIALFFARRPS